MSHELQPGVVIKEKYLIKEVIHSSEGATLYFAFDKKITEKTWLIKEFTFAKDLSEEEIKLRRQDLENAIESLKVYDHKNIARIVEYFTLHNKDFVVMEYIEGDTLQELTEKTESFSEEQILRWAIQLCDILEYFRNRPSPFIFGILDPSRIILDKNGDLRLANFGLNRFFGKIEHECFSREEIYFTRHLNSLGELLMFLATKIKTTDTLVLKDAALKEETKSAIIRCMDLKAHTLYSSFVEIIDLFESILKEHYAPPPPPKPKIEILREKVSDAVHGLILNFIYQPLYYKVAEALGFIAVLIVLYFALFHPHPYAKKGAVVYVLCGDKEIVAIDPNTHKTVDKIALELPVNFIQCDLHGEQIFLSVSRGSFNKIQMINCKDDKLDPSVNITVDSDPRNILIDEKSNMLYIINKKTNNISVVSLKSNKMTGLIPVGKDPSDIKIKTYLFVANSGSKTISVINRANLKTIKLLPAGDTLSAIIISKYQWKLFAACRGLNYIKEFTLYSDAKGQLAYEQAFVKDIGGKKPIALYLNKPETYLYSVNSNTNNVTVIDVETKKIKKSIKTGKTPSGMVFIDPYLWVINYGSGTVSIINTYTNSLHKSFFVGKNPRCITYAP